MIGALLGLIVIAFGWAVIANAAFSERAQVGFYICIGGAVLLIGGIIEICVRVFG